MDGIDNLADNCPNTANDDQSDTDDDGTPDGCDDTPNGDDDGDGVDNNDDICEGFDDNMDTDGDGTPDGCDTTPNGDDDQDGVDNEEDNCPNTPNPDQIDLDGDGVGDACEEVTGPTQKVSVVLECVKEDGNGGFIAVFGYDNDNEVTVIIPVGTDNKLTPNDNNNLLVTEFLPGRQVAVFEVPFDGSNLVWSLKGPDGNTRTATASEDSQQCEVDDDGCFAMEVVDYSPNAQSNGDAILMDRSNPEVALGEPDKSDAPGGFVSLGIEGSITLKFSGLIYDAPGADIAVYETSFSGGSNAAESALIEVSQNGIDWFFATELVFDGEFDISTLPLDYVSQIRITDMGQSTGDGYDVDGVEAINGCSDIPVGNDLCYGSFVVEGSYMPGPLKNGEMLTDPERNDPNKALGEPQNDDSLNFVALGHGGEIIIGFDGVVLNQEGDDIEIVETTFGTQDFDSYPEAAEAFVSQDGINFYFVGTVLTNESARFDISSAEQPLAFIRFVKLVDVTPMGSPSGDGFDLDGITSLSGCTPSGPGPDCGEFRYLVADKKANEPIKLYVADIVGNDANLTMVASRPVGVSVAYDFELGVVYGVKPDGDQIEVINPSDGSSFGFINIDAGLSGIYAAVYDDGLLYLGSGSQDKIYAVDVTTGSYTIEASNVPVNGGDLVIKGDDLYMATKSGDRLFLIEGGLATEVFDIPDDTNGAAITANGDFAFVSRNSGSIAVLDNFGNPIESFNLKLGGEDFTFSNGDLTSGCNLGEPIVIENLAHLTLLGEEAQLGEVSRFVMYPVPARDVLNVKVSSQRSGSVSYEIVSTIGSLLLSETVKDFYGETEISMDVSSLADGAYFFILTIDGESITKKFVISDK